MIYVKRFYLKNEKEKIDFEKRIRKSMYKIHRYARYCFLVDIEKDYIVFYSTVEDLTKLYNLTLEKTKFNQKYNLQNDLHLFIHKNHPKFSDIENLESLGKNATNNPFGYVDNNDILQIVTETSTYQEK